MKRFVALSLAFLLLLAAAPAAAATFTSLRQLQDFIYSHAPAQYESGCYAELSGVVAEIDHCGPNNHHNLTLLVNEENALKPMGSDCPTVTVHFRLHLEEPPFKVGDTITVFGWVNSMYTSYMVPFIQAVEINGSEEF